MSSLQRVGRQHESGVWTRDGRRSQSSTPGRRFRRGESKRRASTPSRRPGRSRIHMENEPLPPGWRVSHSKEGRPYFYNKAENLTQWNHPTAASAKEGRRQEPQPGAGASSVQPQTERVLYLWAACPRGVRRPPPPLSPSPRRRTRAHAHTHAHTHARTHTYTHTLTRARARAPSPVPAPNHGHRHAPTNSRTHACTFHVLMHARTDTQTHTHTNSQDSSARSPPLGSQAELR